MSPVRIEDLNPRARKAAEERLAEGGGEPKRQRPRRSSARTRTPYRCATCGATFDDYPPAERHADTHPGGARLDARFLYGRGDR